MLAFVTGRSLFDLKPSTQQLLRGFQRAFLYVSFRIYFRLSGPGSLISLTLSSC